MNFKEYFASVKGTGVLSTADDDGVVNAAVYGTPHTIEDGLLSFIMRERKTHKNIEVNPHACFLFIEAGTMTGKRIYLTKEKEEKNTELLFSLRRHCKKDGCKTDENLYLVSFRVDKVLPLVGAGEEN
ncbi:pyridoxamine 5'-phosphate oxidase family protein [Pelosinus sp. sgz500959]|uniref:pyridoxamine 5'-phosphate oxidase family protein n=1 Tax=Pelosinus sp. sgz500959 TaxID=3242472 RepID=UPI0036733D8B